MKTSLENINLKSMSKTEVEDEEGTSESFIAVFENKDKQLKATIKQPKEFVGLSVGQDYEVTISNPQTKL